MYIYSTIRQNKQTWVSDSVSRIFLYRQKWYLETYNKIPRFSFIWMKSWQSCILIEIISLNMWKILMETIIRRETTKTGQQRSRRNNRCRCQQQSKYQRFDLIRLINKLNLLHQLSLLLFSPLYLNVIPLGSEFPVYICKACLQALSHMFWSLWF